MKLAVKRTKSPILKGVQDYLSSLKGLIIFATDKKRQ